jgi:predicted dehydrogenase
MKRFGVAVIGVGAISESEHVPSLLKIPSCKVTSICDVKTERLDLIGGKYNIEKRFLDYKEAVDDNETDAVVVATDAPAHADIVLYAVEKQKPVFVEKPIAINIADAEKIVKKSSESNVPVMVGYQLRFLPNHIKVKEILQSGNIGNIYMAHVRAETLVIKEKETLLIDYATHFFDLIRYYFDSDKICCVSGHIKFENDAQVGSSTLLEFESGIHANVEAYWLPNFNWGVVDRSVEFLGSIGKITTKLTGPDIKLWRTNSFRDRMLGPKILLPKEAVTSYTPLSDHSYYQELKVFFDCLLHNKTMPITAEDGLKALQIADYALESCKKKQKIEGLKL